MEELQLLQWQYCTIQVVLYRTIQVRWQYCTIQVFVAIQPDRGNTTTVDKGNTAL